MAIFNRVLCPVDSSPFAARALRYGAALAQRWEAELTVLTVRPKMPALGLWAAHNLMLPPEMPDERERAVALLREFVQRETLLENVAVVVKDGPIVGEILRVAGERMADLIVMGTHGASGFERWVIGSTTERVLRRTTIPVLTIPASAPESPHVDFRRVLCALDRSAAACTALQHAVRFASEGKGRLVVVHVVEHFLDEDACFSQHFDNEACYRSVEHELRAWYAAMLPSTDTSAEIELVMRRGKAREEILRVASEHHADLLVVGTASEAPLFGSTAHAIVRAASAPVLVVAPGAERDERLPERDES